MPQRTHAASSIDERPRETVTAFFGQFHSQGRAKQPRQLSVTMNARSRQPSQPAEQTVIGSPRGGGASRISSR